MAAVNNFRRRDLLQLVLTIVIIMLLNVIGGYVYHRFDLTAEKRFTLSPATVEMLGELDDVIYVRVYLEGDFPAGFQRLRNSTKEMLDEFRAISRDNIQYEFIDPGENPDPRIRDEVYQQLTKQGLQYTNLEVMEGSERSELIIFPGAILSYRGREVPLQLLKSQIGVNTEVMLNNSIQNLEYEFAKAFRKLTMERTSVVAFSEDHGELLEEEVAGITKTLSEFYHVKRVRLDEKLNSLDGIDLLIIARPDSVYSDKDLYILDQFIMRGGSVLWLLDKTTATMDSLANSPTTFALPLEINLDDQLFRYGARVNTTLVQDLQSAPIPIVVGYVGNQPRQKMFPWYYFPLMMPQSDHPVVKNLNAVKAEFISTVDTISRPGIIKTPLLHTSRYTKVLQTPLRVSLNTLRDEPDLRQFSSPHKMTAVLLEGEFESNFKNRLPPEFTNSPEINFREKSVPTRMIVAGDGDLIRNQVHPSGQIYPLGFDRYTGEIYGNEDFILNAVTYLIDESGLINIRTRDVKLRLLDHRKVNEEKNKWILINATLPVILIWLLGLTLFWWRRRKYSRTK